MCLIDGVIWEYAPVLLYYRTSHAATLGKYNSLTIQASSKCILK